MYLFQVVGVLEIGSVPKREASVACFNLLPAHSKFPAHFVKMSAVTKKLLFNFSLYFVEVCRNLPKTFLKTDLSSTHKV